jgi:hypothetical protein
LSPDGRADENGGDQDDQGERPGKGKGREDGDCRRRRLAATARGAVANELRNEYQ